MITQKIIAIIDCKLREIKIKPNSYFVGISVILNGDNAQLLPVVSSTLYDKQFYSIKYYWL